MAVVPCISGNSNGFSVEFLYCDFNLICSSYPDKRVKKDDKGRDMGVVGSVSLLQNVTLATQPIGHIDWSPDKVIHEVHCYTPVTCNVSFCRKGCWLAPHLTKQFVFVLSLS